MCASVSAATAAARENNGAEREGGVAWLGVEVHFVMAMMGAYRRANSRPISITCDEVVSRCLSCAAGGEDGGLARTA